MVTVLDTMSNLYTKTSYRVDCHGGVEDNDGENTGVN